MRHLRALAIVFLGSLVFAALAQAGDVKTTPSGLRIEVLQPGQSGTNPKAGDIVEVHYRGTLTNGTKFDASYDRGKPFKFQLGKGQVIKGWDEGLLHMSVGSKARLTVPWNLAYGERGRPPTIPPKADLVFEVELLSVKTQPVFPRADPTQQKITGSGIKWQVLGAGTGARPRTDQGVTLGLNMWDTKGNLLIWGDQRGIEFTKAVPALPVKFMAEASQLMQEGSRCRFEVPANLAFGAKSQPGLPANSVTVWEIELRKVHDVPKFRKADPAREQRQASGLVHEVIRAGAGRKPKVTDRVKVHYTGWLTDGTLFDSSHMRAEPIVFGLQQVIPGWTEGVQLMKEGGISRFTIPGNMAYGKRGSPPAIPPDATLVFVVELISIE